MPQPTLLAMFKRTASHVSVLDSSGSIKRSLSQVETTEEVTDSPQKRQKSDTALAVGLQRSSSVASIFAGPGGRTAEGPKQTQDPLVIMSWNANGIGSRLKSPQETEEFKAMLREHKPDVLCIQELKLPANGPKGCIKGDGKWRNQAEIKNHTPAEREDLGNVNRVLMAQGYDVKLSLADSKYSGTAMLIKRGLRPRRVWYNIPSDPSDWYQRREDGAATDKDNCAKAHDPEGRIILAEFATFDLLATYAPNNGWAEQSFVRRRLWDSRIKSFLEARGTRGIIWTGDLNVSHRDIDLSHPEFSRRQRSEKASDPTPADPDDRGQPGCTRNEQDRFDELLQATRLTDSYRLLHPNKSENDLTWRGGPGVVMVGKYHGKGMRLDYFLVPEEMKHRIKRSEILGHGADRHGFLGSDHCPVLLELLPEGGCVATASADAVETGGPAVAG